MLLLLPAVAFFFSTAPLPLEAIHNQKASPALYDVKGQLFHVRLSEDSEWRLPVALSDMGKWLPLVAVGVEDRRFYSHGGVDLRAIARAAWQNAVSFRVVSGASTITSQLVRLSVSNRTKRPRGLAVKAREFAQALKLERVLSKEEILESYLNLAPFGGNVRGVQAASRIYFGKPASKLSPGEACLLIGMLKGPSIYRPDRHPEAAGRRRNFIIRLMRRRGIFTKYEADRALLEELPSRWNPLSSRAFHFADMVLPARDSQGAGPIERGPGRSPGADTSLHTSLDMEAQTKLEAILRQTVAPLPDFVTAAAGVIDNRSGGLAAWVGNARFGEASRTAWVDCGRALRSPGSALKPFAYLAAFDKGILTPGSLLMDSPLAFLGRAPRNFDLTYRGAVSARVALSDSLNAPAVRVLRLAEPGEVLRLLREFGFENLTRPAAYYGDSLILGGCEVTVLQMLSAYSALAGGGVRREPALLKNTNRRGTRLASAEAVWMITDILDNRGRLAAFARESLGAEWHVAFKTGTSYGLRDAWTAAWTPDFTVVVWVGNPEGDAWPGLVGVQVAAPAALSALRHLSPRSRWYGRPAGLEEREVCSLSGRPPTAACLVTRRDWSIQGVTQSLPCDIHVLRGGRKTVLWPAELGVSPLNSTETEIRRRPEMIITSPIAQATYYLAPLATEQKIPLRAEGASGKVWWYLNGQYIGFSPPGEAFYYGFPDGRHSISASDEEGRSASSSLTVVSPGKKQEAPLLQGNL